MDATAVSWAYELAEAHLAGLPRRWRHTVGVWRQAQLVRPVVGPDGDVLEAAALLHDIGYAQKLQETGFHPIDGARFLRRADVDEVLACLVAHHSCAHLEAEERHLVAELDEFSSPDRLLADALIICDMTSSPDGEVVTPDDRIAEIRQRYDADGPVGRFIRRAEGPLKAAAGRIDQLRAAVSSTALPSERR